MKTATLHLLLVILLAACAAPTPPPTPAPTDTPVPTADAGATSTALAATVEAKVATDVAATAAAATSEANAVATAVMATRLVEASATAARATVYAAQTATELARATPTPPPTATATPRPTNTAGPSPTPRPTKAPTSPPTSLSIGYSDMSYSTWGRPVGSPNPCSQFNDGDPVRKLYVNVTLTNNGTKPTGLWVVDAWDANGNPIVACFFFYGDWSVQPGESKSVTWAAYCDLGTYVRRYMTTIYDWDFNVMETFTQCFGPNGELSGCE